MAQERSWCWGTSPDAGPCGDETKAERQSPRVTPTALSPPPSGRAAAARCPRSRLRERTSSSHRATSQRRPRCGLRDWKPKGSGDSRWDTASGEPGAAAAPTSAPSPVTSGLRAGGLPGRHLPQGPLPSSPGPALPSRREAGPSAARPPLPGPPPPARYSPPPALTSAPPPAPQAQGRRRRLHAGGLAAPRFSNTASARAWAAPARAGPPTASAS